MAERHATAYREVRERTSDAGARYPRGGDGRRSRPRRRSGACATCSRTWSASPPTSPKAGSTASRPNRGPRRRSTRAAIVRSTRLLAEWDERRAAVRDALLDAPPDAIGESGRLRRGDPRARHPPRARRAGRSRLRGRRDRVRVLHQFADCASSFLRCASSPMPVRRSPAPASPSPRSRPRGSTSSAPCPAGARRRRSARSTRRARSIPTLIVFAPIFTMRATSLGE